jgi:hypothetical protein
MEDAFRRLPPSRVARRARTSTEDARTVLAELQRVLLDIAARDAFLVLDGIRQGDGFR